MVAVGVDPVNLNIASSLPDVNHKLTAMGVDEQISIYMASGAAALGGAVNCTPAPGVSNLPGPPVKVLVGTENTEVISAGQTAGNTGEGTWHLASCQVSGDTGSGNTGSVGNTGTG